MIWIHGATLAKTRPSKESVRHKALTVESSFVHGRVIVRSWKNGSLSLVHLNSKRVQNLPTSRWQQSDRTYSITFSPDGRFLVEMRESVGIYIWDVQEQHHVGIHEISDTKHLKNIWIDCDGNFRDAEGRDVGRRIDDPQRGPAWVTAARLYRMGVVDGQPLAPTGPTPIPLNAQPVRGTFDEDITFRCRRCGQRAPLTFSVLATINSIHRNAQLDPSSSPVLELPDEAWDNEPGLDFQCPACQQPHRSTPFVIDRRPS